MRLARHLVCVAGVAAIIIAALVAQAQPPPPKAKGIESEGYQWNEMMGEKAEALEAVFQTIDSLEKTEMESRVRVLYEELFHWALLPALGLIGIERLLLATRLRRIP